MNLDRYSKKTSEFNYSPYPQNLQGSNIYVLINYKELSN